MDSSNVTTRLFLLRNKMLEEKIDYYLIPTTDFHDSEYVSDYFKVREYFSGFTGSNGSLLVWQEGAGLWTDGRYFIQAAKELAGSEIKLYKMQEKNVPTILEFLKDNMKKGQTLGFDGRVIRADYGKQLLKELKNNAVQIKDSKDLAETIWKERPKFPQNPVFFLSDHLTGMKTKEKISWLRTILKEKNADGIFLTKLDEIMWLFNMRGRDVYCNPVAMSYAYITHEKTWIFLQDEAIQDQEFKLKENNVIVKDYNHMFDFMKIELSQGVMENKTILLDFKKISFSVWKLFGEQKIRILDETSPLEEKKAIKTQKEIEQMRKIYLKDSVIVTKFIYWLKHTVGEKKITEAEAANYLDHLRSEIKEFIELSFPTISAYGANAAMMHYEADPYNCSVLEKKGMLLVDSGGQYFGGTTDVTRTIVLGEISEEIKKQYSAVVSGMLSLSDAVFLKGCTGRNLDILARLPLWKMGSDYKCGTGHGVGYLLNVHEGPQSIRWKYVKGIEEALLEEGMVVTDEPGIYIEGSHGIRIENVLLVQKKCENADGEFLSFENLTYVPIDKAAVKKEYMSEEHWNLYLKYQKNVYEKISPYLSEKEVLWLKEETQFEERKF